MLLYNVMYVLYKSRKVWLRIGQSRSPLAFRLV